MKLALFLAASVASVAVAGTVNSPYQVGTWQGFRTAAVSYTFDDNCTNQYVVAVPMLNAKGFKATLFTVTGWVSDWSNIQNAAANGHEIGSHTVDHSDFASSSTDQNAECQNSQSAINLNVPSQKCVTIAYPYCDTGSESITAQYYSAGRVCSGQIESTTPADFYGISSIICGDLGTTNLNGTADSATNSGGWCVFLIHGIKTASAPAGDGYSPLDSAVLQSSINYMDTNRSRFWVQTFGNVVRYIRERNDVSVSETASSASNLTVSVTGTLDSSIYNFPITIRRPLPAGWTTASAYQNSKDLGAQIVTNSSTKYVMFDAVPNSGSVTLTSVTNVQCNIYMATNQQAIDGFGFSSAWSGQLTAAKNNALYNTLGMSILRVRIDENNNWNDEITNAAAAHAAGAKVFGTAWFGPGAWRDTNNYVLPIHYVDFANWLNQAANAHNLDWVSPANEPDLGWQAWTSSQLTSWTALYGPNVGKPLIEAESCWFSDSYMNPIIDDTNAGPNISVFAGHLYGVSPSVHQDALNKGKHVWMTEHYINGEDDITACMSIAQEISDCMNDQMSAYIWWWVTDGDTNVNLVMSDGTIHKNGYTIGQFAKWIRPGSTRVGTDYNPSSGIFVTAYNVNGSAVIVAVNAGTNSVNQPFAIHNGSAALLEGYRTSSSQNMADLGSFTVSSGSFSATLPAQSVTTFVQTNGAPASLPSAWTALDVGSVGIVGSTTYTNSVATNGVFTVTASGDDIWNTADAFRFVYMTNSANFTMIAHVISLQNIDQWSKAGIMVRDSLSPNAANALIAVTPGNGVTFQYRSSGGGGSYYNATAGSAPYWVKLVRGTNTFTGYCSPDGTNWTLLGSTTLTNITTAYLGLAVTAHNNTNLCTAIFDNVSATGWPVPPPSAPAGLTATNGVEQATLTWQAGSYATSYKVQRATAGGGPYTTIATVVGTRYVDSDLVGGTTYYYLVTAVNSAGQMTNSTPASATPTANVPSPWVAQDVGVVGSPAAMPGNEIFTNGGFMVTASGDDIWNSADAFRFVYIPVTNNYTIIARVVSVDNVDAWSKAGVMIRESLNSNSANAFVAVTPGNGVTWQCRSTTGGGTVNATTTGLSAPYWVKLVRSTNTFTGYISADGTNWTQQGTATFTMAATVYMGVAVTAHNNSDLCTAVFDNVTVPNWTPPGFTWLAPVPITTADATLVPPTGQVLAGAATFGGTAYTVTLTNGTQINFTADGSVATATGYGTATGAFSGNTGNANFNAVLNAFNYDGGPKTITLTNLTPGVQYTVQLFGLDDRSGENLRQAYLQDPYKSGNVSQIWQMGSNVCVKCTFTAWKSTEAFIEQLPGNSSGGDVGDGNANALVLWSALSAPAGLTATPVSASQINLAWNAVTNAASYNVKRSLTNGGPYTVIASGVTATNYSNSGLAGGTIYYYVVSATVSGTETANSAQASAITLSGSYGSLIHRYSFSETNGTNTADSQGGPIWNGTLPNSGTLGGGQVQLQATNSQYVSLPAGIAGSLTNFTFMAWVNLSSSSNWSRIFDFGNDTTTYMFLTPQNGSNGKLRFSIMTNSGVGEQQINCGSTLSTGARHQMAVSLSGTTGVLYLDGAAVGTNSAMTINPSSLGNTVNNYLGKSQFPDPYMNGSLDEFRIYNAALSPAEIAATDSLGPNQLLSTNGAPTGLTATAGSAQVSLVWNALSGATSYNLARSTTSGGGYVTVASPATTNYIDTAVTNGTTYYYVVAAVSGGTTSTNSAQVSATPAKLSATVTLGNLSQTYNGAARSATATTTPNGLTVNLTYNGSASAPTNVGSYTVIGTINDANYQGSATNTLVINPAIPSAPTGLAASAGDGIVTLSWSASATATNYYLKRSLTSGGYTAIATNASLVVTNTGLVNGTLYYYVVSAVNISGESTNSPQVSARPTSSAPLVMNLANASGQLQLSWPSDHTGWLLQAQTNSIASGLGTNWTTVANTTETNRMTIGVDPARGSVFFRLMLP